MLSEKNGREFFEKDSEQSPIKLEEIEVKFPSVEEFFSEGNSFFKSHDYENALRCFNKAHSLHQENISVFIRRGETYLLLGKYELALIILKEAEKLLLLKEEYKTSKEKLKQTIFVLIGKTYNSLNEYEEAKEKFSCVLEINPNNIEALISLGKTCCSLGEYSQATRYFNNALSLAQEKYNSQNVQKILVVGWHKSAQEIVSIDNALKYFAQKKQEASDWKKKAEEKLNPIISEENELTKKQKPQTNSEKKPFSLMELGCPYSKISLNPLNLNFQFFLFKRKQEQKPPGFLANQSIEFKPS